MEQNEFVDFYELLQVSPNAHADTIDRVFRHLAQRYHPDNQKTGDTDQFQKIMDAHETLKNSDSRARYDIRYRQAHEQRLRLTLDLAANNGLENDAIIRNRLLALLYAKRRNDARHPGLGNYYVAQMLGCPTETLEFHLWYLKEKGWITRLDDGSLAITAAGVDQTNGASQASGRADLQPNHLLTYERGSLS
jgi:curved DNA-binding protein CbpA